MIAHSGIELQALYVLMFGITLFKPLWGIGLLLVIMPWLGGSQPGEMHTIRFLTLFSGVCLGSMLNSIWSMLFQRRGLRIDYANPLTFAILVYWLITALSVVWVPTHGLLRALFVPSPDLSLNLLKLFEANDAYPWLSLVTLSLAMWLFLFLCDRFRERYMARAYLLQCLGVGVLVSVVAGILDYFDIATLTNIRPGGGNAFQYERLTSVFGNPTWFAQYLVLSAPAVMSVLYLHWRKSLVIGLMLFLIILTEFCILLVNQRGGWLAYPMTLVVIWFCIYVLGHEDGLSGAGSRVLEGLKRSWLKIVITLPLTLLVSLSIVYMVAGMNEGGRQQVLGFVERAKTIQNVNDRLAFLAPTLKLLSRNPVLGTGVDSFHVQYEKAFMVEGHPCTHDDPYTTQARGSAHNLYFQTLVGKGVVGLLALIGVIAASMALAWRGVFRNTLEGAVALDRERQITLMAGLAFTLAMIVYSNVGEIFYSPINYLVFAVFYATSASAGDGLYRLSIKIRWSVILFLALAFVLHWYLLNFVNLACGL